MFTATKTDQIDDPAPRLRQISDLTTSGWLAQSNDKRTGYRYNRALPTLLVHWDDGRPIEDEWAIVLTKDISDSGVGLVLGMPIDVDEVVIGFWLPDENMHAPWFFVGEPRYCAPIGGGYWTLGVQLVEFANDKYRDELECLLPLAEKLLPAGQTIAP